MESLQHWGHFPLRVAFLHSGSFSAERQDAALAGFSQWVDATGQAVNYRVASDPHTADVVVAFDPGQCKSETNTEFDTHSHLLSRAYVRIGLDDVDDPGSTVGPSEIRALAAHEFGHALGIDGHSPDPRDLMYPSLSDNNRDVTSRDLNTLRAAYSAPFHS